MYYYRIMIMKFFKAIWENFLYDHLFRNSIYLMLTTGFMGLFGFIFWTIATHLFSPSDIGLGTTVISAMTMISYISLLGFNNTFIRFLPTSPDKNLDINSGTFVVVLTSVVLSVLYIFSIPFITPNLSIIGQSFLYALIFVLFTTGSALNSLTDSIFIAFRKAQYNLITDGFIISISKLMFPILFVSFGAYGVFTASGISLFIGLLASISILIFRFDYKPSLRVDFKEIRKIFSYSFASYFASLFSMIPTVILPIIIINHLSSADAGYFYLSFMIMNVLYTVSGSVSQSLFAEGSYGDNLLRGLLKRSVIILVTILVPASIVLAYFGPYILKLFGKTYSEGAAGVITILALSSPIVAAFNVGSTLLKIRHQMYAVVFVNAVYALTICALALMWVGNGLIWVAYAWISGNALAAGLTFIFIYAYRHLPTKPAESYRNNQTI